ncbi:hypothetical protein P4O66_004429 [Electrophorus voltai]|uniref:Uncharacterized protein n=1 Tax=Electrophorus voltai TaxID=2609070 RepID=A0AAD8ZR83_9TELE|nr:hypothetical protein P4O66_004429 [Electrophorus voltai]
MRPRVSGGVAKTHLDALTVLDTGVLKAQDVAFTDGDAEAYSSAKAKLKRGDRKAKHTYKLSIEEHFHSSDPRRMRMGIQSITGYKPPPPTLPSIIASLPDELNQCYARFSQQ